MTSDHRRKGFFKKIRIFPLACEGELQLKRHRLMKDGGMIGAAEQDIIIKSGVSI